MMQAVAESNAVSGTGSPPRRQVGQQFGRGREALGELVHDPGVLGPDRGGIRLANTVRTSVDIGAA
jgi:hypothetical protein